MAEEKQLFSVKTRGCGTFHVVATSFDAAAKAVSNELNSQDYGYSDDRTLAMRRMELEQEYEKKKLQLELDTPKRFAQGEWVSGKTLTEIIKALTAGKKED